MESRATRGLLPVPVILREVCYNKLAERMKEAGYKIEEARKIGFHIKGFPAVLREQFSKRNEEIERIAARA